MEKQLPILKQFVDLTPTDFEDYPVWIQCHVEDYDEPWYDDTDEETFRPWTKELPVSPDYGMFLVSASFKLHDGTTAHGFLTPDNELKETNALGAIQPQIFTNIGPVGFWTGMFPMNNERKEKIYLAFNKTPDQIFPIQFKVKDGLSKGTISGTINGFLTIEDGRTIKVSR